MSSPNWAGPSRISRPPAIIPPRAPRRWVRDPGISTMIDYYDEPDHNSWDKLVKAERDKIFEQLELCRANFYYAAKNYFWITTKDRGDVLFSLWESQELILEYNLRLKALYPNAAQKVQIIKSRALGCSTLIEGMIAWRTMYFKNVNAVVVSYDPGHAAYLFGIMQHIYDRMPWWMKPQCASREFKKGLIFDTDQKDRYSDPGLNSQVEAYGANKITGIQGKTYMAFHGSEHCDWEDKKARTIIEEDIRNAIPDNPEAFGFLESTGKGAGRYAHLLWRNNMELEADGRADWKPLFLPSFFDRSHFTAPPDGWTVKEEESGMRERVEREWVRCDNSNCQQFHQRRIGGLDRSELNCPTCNNGTLRSYVLPDGFLRWMELRRVNAHDEEALKKLHQEQCVSAEEAFQVSGIQLFNESIMRHVTQTIRDPIMRGDLDKQGRFHAFNPRTERCIQEDCDRRHEFEVKPLEIWELPNEDFEYAVGVDPAGGGGGASDYCCMWVNKVNRRGGADEQVAKFRSNELGAIEQGYKAVALARWYNEALLAIEYNNHQSCGDTAHVVCQYKNLYRRINADSISPQLNSVHWLSTVNTRPKLREHAIRWLTAGMWIIHSRNAVEEMKTYRMEDEYDRHPEAAKGFKDDEITAGMIALLAARFSDFDPNLGYVPLRRVLNLDTSPWIMQCCACDYKFPAKAVAEVGNCPHCGSLLLTGYRNLNAEADPETDTTQNLGPEDPDMELWRGMLEDSVDLVADYDAY